MRRGSLPTCPAHGACSSASWSFAAGVGSAGGEKPRAHGDAAASAQQPDTLARFRAYNIAHAELLGELLDVAPLTRMRLEAILETAARPR